MTHSSQVDPQVETALNSFDRVARDRALRAMLTAFPTPPPPSAVANMHCHTFYSFNAYGYSPTGLAWLARQRGYELLGIVDFDVLDAVSEYLDACDLLGVRGSAGLETRTYIPEFASYEINSPGEPGVCYHMGIGFTTSAAPPVAARELLDLRGQAAQRNRGLVARVNAYLAPVTVDYDRDVLPLTPAGNATERHIVLAYLQAAARQTDDLAGFWAARLDLPRETVVSLLQDDPAMQNMVRGRLMKKGGPGYVQPDAGAFPPLERINALTVACGALPCAAWLDGASDGEQRYAELLDMMVGQGVVALNIVPDRNWNIADPEQAALKQRSLYEVVALAKEMDLPLNVGSEMNSFGQKLVDDFDAPALAPVRAAFLDGAYFVYGHTALARGLGLGYQSAWAKSELPTRRERNAFFTAAGRALLPGPARLEQLARLSPEMNARDLLAALAAE